MILRPTTIKLHEDGERGSIHISVVMQREDGESTTATTIKRYPAGRIIEAVADKLDEILKEMHYGVDDYDEYKSVDKSSSEVPTLALDFE